jgi:hypothetical protein
MKAPRMAMSRASMDKQMTGAPRARPAKAGLPNIKSRAMRPGGMKAGGMVRGCGVAQRGKTRGVMR